MFCILRSISPDLSFLPLSENLLIRGGIIFRKTNKNHTFLYNTFVYLLEDDLFCFYGTEEHSSLPGFDCDEIRKSPGRVVTKSKSTRVSEL